LIRGCIKINSKRKGKIVSTKNLSITIAGMKITKYLLSMIIISLFTGCATQKPIEWSAIGGSRSDATVKLAYSYKYGTPNPDINQAIHLAKSRCASWGYASAELFGGESKVCNGQIEPGLLGVQTCTGEWTVTKEFQCTGEGNASKTSASQATDADTEEEPAPVKKRKKRKK
jgi:hypothetical protein